MIELKKNFFIESKKSLKKMHKKNYINDMSMLKDIKNFTLNDKYLKMADKLYKKITRNEYLTVKDVDDFYTLYYLNYIKIFLPFERDTIDKALEEFPHLKSLNNI